MEPFTLINPKGDRRDFGFVGFFAFKTEVAQTKTFQSWAAANNVTVFKEVKGQKVLDTPVVDRFLQERGYTIIDNDIFGRKSMQ